MKKDELFNKFSFDDRMIKIWPFLDDYQKKIYLFFTDIQLSDEQEKRFILIGLFPYYRGAVHRSSTFSTDINLVQRKKTKERYEMFNTYWGSKINSTQEYLKLISLKDTKNINAQSLFDFVVSGKDIG